MKLKNAIDSAVSHNAFKWCSDKGLITNPTYIK